MEEIDLEKNRDDLLFGQIAKNMGLVDGEQLEECLRIQEKLPEDRPLGQIFIERGYINENELSRIVKKQRETLRRKGRLDRKFREDKRYGKLVQRFGFVDQEEIDEALRLQSTLREEEDRMVPIGDILLDRDAITNEQHQIVLDYQKDNILRCPECNREYDVAMYRPGSELNCYACADGTVKVPDVSFDDGEDEEGSEPSDRASDD